MRIKPHHSIQSGTEKELINVIAICKRRLFYDAMADFFSMHDIRLLKIYETREAALQALTALPVDSSTVLIIDANWQQPSSSVDPMIYNFREIMPDIPVIVTTNFYEPSVIACLDKWRANGYFYRTTEDVQDIINCVKNVAHGKVCHVPDPAHLITRNYPRN